jgi:hypothetical protein
VCAAAVPPRVRVAQVSADKDLMQLCTDPRVRLLDSVKMAYIGSEQASVTRH